MPIKRALISVSDKSGIAEFAKSLSLLDIEIISTGGTAKLLQEMNIPVTEVSNFTGYPEMMAGRVKTLNPKIHGGILARRGIDEEVMLQNGIKPIDLVVVNLYPFQETIKNPNSTEEEAIENIDIGGPAMLRSSAKNHISVTVVVDSKDYQKVLNEITDNGDTTLSTRQSLAMKTFEHTAQYDGAIANYLGRMSDGFSNTINLQFVKSQTMRYGENPHQAGRFFGDLDGILKQLHGKALSYNNLLDVDAAVSLMEEFKNDAPTFAIMKHNNACGLATRDTLSEAYTRALEGDPVSAFGGVLIANQPIDLATANQIHTLFCEVVIAPRFDAEALDVLKGKKNRILLERQDVSLPTSSVRTALNGFLVQERDNKMEVSSDLTCVTEANSDENEIADMLFAMKLAKHTKSNTIVFAKDGQLLASGTGQTSRVDALKQAVEKAAGLGLSLEGSSMASDAFFPFPDCVTLAAEAGIKNVIQPGGSINDNKSIDACNALGLAMYTTGTRHFRH